LPVYHGYEQYGGGFGNFLGRMARGVWDFIRPAALSAGTSMISNAAQGLAEGKSLKDTARSAFGASVGSAVRGLGDEAQRRVQSGSGRRRKRKRRAKQTSTRHAPKRKATKRKAAPKKRRVYKRRRTSRKAFSNF
ncbi:MAG: hypothetical protein FD142_3191, partial [bacterium]